MVKKQKFILSLQREITKNPKMSLPELSMKMEPLIMTGNAKGQRPF
jgi:hypothetical protein